YLRQQEWEREPSERWRWRNEIAALEFLSRTGGSEEDTQEDDAFAHRESMTVEDQARLAELLARHGKTEHAHALLTLVWAQVRLDGREAALKDSTWDGWPYFRSTTRPLARVLHAALIADPTNRLIGPMAEGLIGRHRAMSWWNTQDYAFAVWALAAFV